MLATAAVYHASRMGATGAVHCALGDRLVEHGVRLWVWDLSTHNSIEVCCGARPVVWVHDQKQYAHAAGRAFKFYWVHVGCHTPKDVALRTSG